MQELTVGYLDRLLRPSLVAWRVEGLNRHDDWIVVIPEVYQVVSAVLRRVDHADLLGELLLETRREFVCIRTRKVGIRIEAIKRHL